MAYKEDRRSIGERRADNTSSGGKSSFNPTAAISGGMDSLSKTPPVAAYNPPPGAVERVQAIVGSPSADGGKSSSDSSSKGNDSRPAWSSLTPAQQESHARDCNDFGPPPGDQNPYDYDK